MTEVQGIDSVMNIVSRIFFVILEDFYNHFISKQF